MGHAVGTRPGSFCALSAFPPPRLGEPVREVHSEVSEVCSSDLTETCSRSMDFPFVEKPGMARRSFSWGSQKGKEWLRGLDSNQDSRLQRPMCYQLHHPGAVTSLDRTEYPSLT